MDMNRRSLLRAAYLATTGGMALLAGCPSPGRTVLDKASGNQTSNRGGGSDRNPAENGTVITETPTEAVALRSEPDYGGWFSNVENYFGTVVYNQDRNRVTVVVGAEGNGGQRAFKPPAIAIPEGTEVVWEWTDGDEAYNVVAVNEQFRSGDPTADPETTFRFTFETKGIYKYYSAPQRSAGMKGGVAVYVPR